MQMYDYKIAPLLFTDLEELELMLKAMDKKGWELIGIKEDYYIFKRPANI